MAQNLGIHAVTPEISDWTSKIQIVDISRPGESTEKKIKYLNMIIQDEQVLLHFFLILFLLQLLNNFSSITTDKKYSRPFSLTYLLRRQNTQLTSLSSILGASLFTNMSTLDLGTTKLIFTRFTSSAANNKRIIF